MKMSFSPLRIFEGYLIGVADGTNTLLFKWDHLS